MINKPHQALATNAPPADIVVLAQALVSSRPGPVYLYQHAKGWDYTKKLTQIPSGALITIIQGDKSDPKLWNTEDC